VGGMTRVSKDVPPYSITSGSDDVKVYGLNKVGLRRRGLSREELTALEAAFRLYQDSLLNFGQALAQLEAIEPKTEQVRHLVEFLKTSQRGVYR